MTGLGNFERNAMNDVPPERAEARTTNEELLEPWLRLCAGNREMVESYDRLRGTNLSGRGTPIDRMIDEATGKLEAEALVFFDWCRELFDRLGWDEVDG